MKKTIRVYVATPIRGEHGNAATFEQMQANAKIAEGGLKWLEKNFPWVEFFCPAVHDRIVQRLATKGYVTYDQILECDHEEQALCQVFLAFTWAPSAGVDEERVLARDLKQPMVILHHPSDLKGNAVEYNKLFQLFAHHQLIDTFRQAPASDGPDYGDGPWAKGWNERNASPAKGEVIRVVLEDNKEAVAKAVAEHGDLVIRSLGLDGKLQDRGDVMDGTIRDNAIRPRIGRDHDDDTSCIS